MTKKNLGAEKMITSKPDEISDKLSILIEKNKDGIHISFEGVVWNYYEVYGILCDLCSNVRDDFKKQMESQYLQDLLDAKIKRGEIDEKDKM